MRAVPTRPEEPVMRIFMPVPMRELIIARNRENVGKTYLKPVLPGWGRGTIPKCLRFPQACG